MEETKYGKYFLTGDRLKNTNVNPKNANPRALMESGNHFGAGNFTIEWEAILEPYVVDPVPHYHDFDEYLCWLGSNAANIFDFDAEIEVYVGEEGEKHTIDKCTVLYVPAGLVHCPIIYKRIGKPVLFNVAADRPDYLTSVGKYRTYFIREGGPEVQGGRVKAIEGMKEIIGQNYNAAYAESLKALLRELEKDQDSK